MPDKIIAAANLAEASSLLDLLGIDHFLFLGTALGAYRDHDFCPGDIDDIDVGVDIMYYRPAEIIKVFTDAGFECEHHWNYPDEIAPEMSFVRKYEGWRSKVDLFFVTPTVDGENMQWRFYADPVQTRFISSRFFKHFDKVEFYGTSYNIPGPIEEYLAVNYGANWKTPIHRDNWDWERDNKCNYITS